MNRDGWSGRNRRIVRDIAHARAGDKGNTSNVNVWVYDPADFDLLKATVSLERIKREFPNHKRIETCYRGSHVLPAITAASCQLSMVRILRTWFISRPLLCGGVSGRVSANRLRLSSNLFSVEEKTAWLNQRQAIIPDIC